ncbi:hypothetical protein P0D69_43870 [Paraburkholderia sediminicola]|uniref:hypothetical protein n=1 Tax=Paraburkholderia sediminicola TaxID=458836 RepID=UPI0038BD6102
MPVANFTLVNKNFPNNPHVKIEDLSTGTILFNANLPEDAPPIHITVMANDSGEGNAKIWRDSQPPYNLAVDDGNEYSLS